MDWATNRNDAGRQPPLLSTKLHMARIPASFVQRQRLHERLSEGLKRRLTLISAPPGFGKSTLVSGWMQQGKVSGAWVSLDEGDNDPSRFWAYFIGSLQHLQPRLGAKALALLNAGEHPPIEQVLTELINDLVEVSGQVVLVLDDYHVIENESIHATLSLFIERMPAQLHIFITSRIDPPLRLTRLRARGELIELRASELQFTFQEATPFLNASPDVQLTADDLAELLSLTEGWAVGLQLVAPTFRRSDDPGARRSIKSYRYVVDYLIDEVFAPQSPQIQEFLMKTAILERMNGPLCDAVSGGRDGDAMLERLEKANVFLVPLDNEHRWYRYHTLFSQILQERLAQLHPEMVRGLHQRASQWYEGNGFIDEAVNHLLEGGDLDRAVALAERQAEGMLSRGRLETLLHWRNIFPHEQVSFRPKLALAFAWALLLDGQFDDVGIYLEICRGYVHLGPGEGLADTPGHLATIGSFLAAFGGEAEHTVEKSLRAISALHEASLSYRTAARHYQDVAVENIAASGLHLYESPGSREGEGDLRSPDPRNRFGILDTLPRVGQLQVRIAQLRGAAATWQKTLDLAGRHNEDLDGPIDDIVAACHIGLGGVQYEWNDLDSAQNHVAEATALLEASDTTDDLEEAWIHCARIHHARGDVDQASEALDIADKLARKRRDLGVIAQRIAAERVYLWLSQGNLPACVRWAQECQLNRVDRPASIDEFLQLTVAKVLVAQYKADDVVELLTPLIQRAESRGWNDTLIRALVLQSLALDQQGEGEQGVVTLARGLQMAEPERYTRTIIREGAIMIKLLKGVREAQQRRGAALGVSTSYVDRLLGLLGVTVTAAGIQSPAQPIAARADDMPPQVPSLGSDAPPMPVSRAIPATLALNPISDREREVLELIANGKSNSAIADTLYISLSTVKTHINNLYSKLGVESRTQAIARAREYRLIQ